MFEGKETVSKDMLNSLKMLIGMEQEDSQMNDRLLWILNSVWARLKILLGGIEPPEEMNHIIVEVAVTRYNRIGSEGLESHSVEGESQSFRDSDFDEYMEEIKAFMDAQKNIRRGRVRFI